MIKKLCYALVICYIAATVAYFGSHPKATFAQALTFCALSQNCVWTAVNAFNLGITTRSVNNDVFASQFPGADAGAKIANALAANPTGMIYVDQGGGLTISTPFTIANGQSLMWVQGGTWTLCTVITNGGTLASWMPGAIGGALGADTGPIIIKEGNSCNLAEMVLLSGQAVSIGHLTFDGNASNNSTAGPNIATSTAPRFLIEDVQSTNAKTDGLDITSGSGGGKISHSIFNNNLQDGINCNTASDTWVLESELSGNTRHGAHWVDCPDLRLTHSDLTSNLMGVYGAGTVAGLHSVGFQLIDDTWTNSQEDIEADGTVGGTAAVSGWLIEGCQFVSSTNRTDATYPSILFFQTGYHTVTGNTWVAPITHRPTFAIQTLNSGASASNTIGPNTFTPNSFSTSPTSLMAGPALQDTTMPMLVSSDVQTAKTAAIGLSTLCLAAVCSGYTGQYDIKFNFWGSGTACTVVTAGSVTFLLTWTDEQGTVHSNVALPMDDQTGAAVETVQSAFNFQTALANESASGEFLISTNGSIVQYNTGYTACTTGTGTYNLRTTVTRIAVQ